MIDPQLQAELHARFNPEDSDLRKMQLRMLEMLKYIDKVCRENSIKYWLSSGTCLGAIRHGGFIPWDDDVDIEMCKADFIKLKSILKEKNNSYFKLQDHSQDKAYLAPYAKLRDTKSILKETNTNDLYYKFHGIYIDIFCIEPSSSLFLNKVSTFIQNKFIYPLTWRIHNKFLRRSAINLIFPIVTKLIYPVVSSISAINNHGYFRHIPGSGFEKRRFKDDFEEVIMVPFEDTCLPVPKGYENYLRQIYGDFMKLPSIDSIHPHITKIEFL